MPCAEVMSSPQHTTVPCGRQCLRRQSGPGGAVPLLLFFLVSTDHKNLEYIRTAKRFNTRQARWALFFNRFDFAISYHPGSKNIKADAISRLFDPGSAPRPPTYIPSPSCMVGAHGLLRKGSDRQLLMFKYRTVVP